MFGPMLLVESQLPGKLGCREAPGVPESAKPVGEWKMERSESGHGRLVAEAFALAAGLALVVWLIDAVTDVFVFHFGRFSFVNFVFPDPHEVWMRTLMAAPLVVLSLFFRLGVMRLRRAEELAQRSVGRYRAIFEHSGVALWLLDASHVRQLWMRTTEDLQEHLSEIFTPESRLRRRRWP